MIPQDGLPRAELVHLTDKKAVGVADPSVGPAHSSDIDPQVRPLGWELVWSRAPNWVADAVRAHWETWQNYAFPWYDGTHEWTAQWDGPPTFRGVSATHVAIVARLRNATQGLGDGSGGGGGAPHALGLNVGQLRHWTSGILFKDLAGQAQPWWNQRNSGDWSQNALASPADADGYPTAMPAQGWWATTLLVGQDDYQAGRYTVLYDGAGTLVFGWDARVVSTAPGVIELDVTPSGQGIYVQLTATQVGNHLRNLRIVPGSGGGGGGGATNALGLNVGQLRHWTSGILFRDLAGQAQPWWNQRNSGDWSQSTPASPADADGYPTAMPVEGWWATTLLIGQDDYQSGRYVVTYDGVGTLVFGWDAVVVTSAPGRVEIDVTPSGQGIYVQLTATQVGDHLRNLQILPGSGGGGGGGASSALGLNVGQLRHWTSGLLLADLTGQAQPWWNQRNSGDWSQNTPASPADADGYPTAMPVEGWWATTLLVGQDDYPSGRYVVTYDGVGTLVFGWDAVVAISSPGRIEIDVTPTGQGIYVQLTSTQPGNHLRNLRIHL